MFKFTNSGQFKEPSETFVTYCNISCWGRKIFFLQNYGTAFSPLSILSLCFQYRVACLCHQFLPELSCSQCETLHRCNRHIGDVHKIFCLQKFC